MTDFLPTVDEVYDSSLAEHPEFQQLDESEVRGVISAALGQIASFELTDRKPIALTKEAADNIGTIWIFSGTGSYDEDFKAEDNPSYRGKPGYGGLDRARMKRAAFLARKIAETKSGETTNGDVLHARELISEYGPNIFYSGYPIETANAEELLNRPNIIIPRSRTKILHRELKITTDQITTFEYPDEPGIDEKDVVMVSHAAHLGGRILNMAELYKPFSAGAVPYVSPIEAPGSIRREAALMETRGLVWYAFGSRQAAKTAHPYKFLPGQEQ